VFSCCPQHSTTVVFSLWPPLCPFLLYRQMYQIVRKRLCHSGIMTQKADTSRYHSRQKRVSNPLPVEGHVEVLKREPHTKSTGQNKNSTSDRPISNPSPLAQGAWASPCSSKLLPPTLQLLNIPSLILSTSHYIDAPHHLNFLPVAFQKRPQLAAGQLNFQHFLTKCNCIILHILAPG